MPSSYIQDLIDSLYEDFSDSSNYSKSYIQNWVVDRSNLGKLNSLIGTSFSGGLVVSQEEIDYNLSFDDLSLLYQGQNIYFVGEFTGQSFPITGAFVYPIMGGEESAIYQKLFESDFYRKRVRETLNGVAGANGLSSDWVSLKEGDSSITRVNKSEVLKTLKSIQESVRVDLEYMVLNYLKYKTDPGQCLSENYDRYL